MKAKTIVMKWTLKLVLLILLAAGPLRAAEVQTRVHSFTPPKDVKSMPVNAHAGTVFFYKDVYYWYGVSLTQTLDENQSPVQGIRCYVSKDFYNWFDEGLVLTLNTKPGHDLSAGVTLKRPMVLYDAGNTRFLLYVLIERPGQGSVLGVASAYSPVGPFQYLMGVRPNGYGVADFTVFQQEKNNAVLFYVPLGVQAVHICPMSEDLVVPESKYQPCFQGLGVANLCIFKKDDTFFLAGSLGSDSVAGPGFLGKAKSLQGPWQQAGSMFAGPGYENGYSTVPLSVLAAGRDGQNLIYLGRDTSQKQTMANDTVFLPILFEYGRPIVRPQKTWDMSVFEKGFRRSDNIPPTIPGRVRVLATADDQVWLGWDPSTDDDHIAAYKVYRNGKWLKEVYTTQVHDTDLAFGDQYLYEISAVDLAGNESIRSQKVPVEMGALGGLSADYYPGKINGAAAIARLDKGIDFDFGYNGPAQPIPRDGFTIRWTGKIIPRYSQTYTLILKADDSVQMWIDDKLVIDKKDARGDMAEYRAEVRFASQKPAKIKIEYQDHLGPSSIQLLWQSPDQVREIIPAESLRPSWY